MNNLSLEYFQALKKFYRYLLGARLALKYTGIPGTHIISGVLLGGDICFNVYNNLDWGKDEDNCRSIIGYFFEIAGGVIFWISQR